MRRSLAVSLGLAVALGVGATQGALRPHLAGASSHSEAPMISQDPTADNTDVYAFQSPDQRGTTTIIANWIPKEDPPNGPNFYRFSPTARYLVKVDNTGDGEEDVTFEFRFQDHIRNPNTFLYALPVHHLTDASLNQYQTYTVTRITGGEGRRQHRRVILRNAIVAPANVGPRTMPDYATLAREAIYPLKGGGRVFTGPRDDPFFVDLGAIFDLATIRKDLGLHGGGLDGLSGFNVHSIALQLPTSSLTDGGRRPVIGIYAATERQRVSVLGGARGRGKWVQVSRLGNPLINEVVIPLGRKDYWNTTDPADDSQFDSHYLNPELAADLNLLYGPSGIVAHLFDPPLAEHNRQDLVDVLLTGVKGLNFTGPTHADLLRLNTAIKPVACGSENRMGVLGGDTAGFPNGRRLVDDVVDIELQAIAVKKPYDFLSGKQYMLGDGVDHNEYPFLCSFPYEALPTSGFNSQPHPPTGP